MDSGAGIAGEDEAGAICAVIVQQLQPPLPEHPAAGAAGSDGEIINISETPGEMAPGAKDMSGSGAADDFHDWCFLSRLSSSSI